MKKLWKRFRYWMIRKLGGFTKKQYDDMWTCLETLQNENRTIRIKNTELESRVSWQRNEILRLNVELVRNPPAWKWQKEETFEQRTLQAEMVIRRDAYEITNPVPRAKEHLARQIFNGILPLIHYHFENDFGGNSRVRATLRVLTGPGVAE